MPLIAFTTNSKHKIFCANFNPDKYLSGYIDTNFNLNRLSSNCWIVENDKCLNFIYVVSFNYFRYTL